MRLNCNMRPLACLVLSWIALLTTGIAAQPPELGTHDVSIMYLRTQDVSGKIVEGGILHPRLHRFPDYVQPMHRVGLKELGIMESSAE